VGIVWTVPELHPLVLSTTELLACLTLFLTEGGHNMRQLVRELMSWRKKSVWSLDCISAFIALRNWLRRLETRWQGLSKLPST
jgi:hypothetical protein